MISTMITVLPDGSVQVPSQPGLAPGAYRAMLVVSEPVPRPLLPLPLQLRLLNLPSWPVGSTYWHEDLYNDGC